LGEQNKKEDYAGDISTGFLIRIYEKILPPKTIPGTTVTFLAKSFN